MECDVFIAGAGMAGQTLAIALAQAGLSVVAADLSDLDAQLAPDFDGRASAIAFASFRMLRTLGVAEHLRGAAQPIERIVVSDGRAPDGLRPGGPSLLRLDFDRREIDPRPDGEALGYMVENRHIRSALAACARAAAGLDLRPKTGLAAIEGESVRLSDGARVKPALMVGADGRASLLRSLLGVRTIGWPYAQTAVVATVTLGRPHGGVAHEYFLPAGPFAILPLTHDRANLVWTERHAGARALLSLGETDFHRELTRRFGDFLGDVRVVGPRFGYPLSLQIAERMIAPRAALVGDAAHAIHPIAGQGLNMGLRDVAALAEVVVDAARLGLDPGSETTLERYARWRRFDNMTLCLATDGFNRLFSNDWGPLRLVRDLGLAAVDRLAPARRFFMREAGGGTGDLPRLLRGEALVLAA
jgi:2-octaprenyl-6-methoxyphenol hydroxylase